MKQLGLVAVVALGFVQAPNAPGAPITAGAPGAPVLGMVRWRVVPEQSTIGFDGESTLHDFTGKTRDIAGETAWIRAIPNIRRAAKSRSARPRSTAAIRAAIATCARISRPIASRGSDSRLDALAGRAVDGAGDLSARGRFTIHGVERERTCALHLRPLDGGALHATGDVRFKMSEHGIDPPSVLLVTVDDEVRVWFDLRLEPLAQSAMPAAQGAAPSAQSAVLPARSAILTVATRLEPLGGTPSDASTSERLFATDKGLLWERDTRGTWLVAGATTSATSVPIATSVVDARAARRLAPPPPCETLFADTRERAASMRAKLDALAPEKRAAALAKVSETLGRLEETLAIAPSSEPARVERESGNLRVMIGGVEWLRAQGLDGDEPFLRLCDGLDGLPNAVRTELAATKGLPRELAIRCATPGGVRTLRLQIERAPPTHVPAWAFDLDAWTTAPSSPGR